MTGPRYRQIAAELRERVALGDVAASGSVGSEAELGAAHEASRMTVRKALELLRDEGVLESRPGAGWFVTGHAFRQQLALGTFRHADSAVSEAGKELSRQVVGFSFVAAPPAVARALELPDGSEVLRCRSLRFAGTDPLERSTEWVEAGRAEAVSRSSAAAPGIWATLHRSGQAITGVRQSITAGTAVARDIDLLGAAAGSPLLLVRRTAVGHDGPLALSDHRYLAHRFSLEVEFHGWSDSPLGLTTTHP